MYTLKELTKIRKALPVLGYNLIAEKMGNTTPDAVRMVLKHPKRYQEKVFEAAFEVIKENKERIAAQKAKLMEVVK